MADKALIIYCLILFKCDIQNGIMSSNSLTNIFFTTVLKNYWTDLYETSKEHSLGGVDVSVDICILIMHMLMIFKLHFS